MDNRELALETACLFGPSEANSKPRGANNGYEEKEGEEGFYGREERAEAEGRFKERAEDEGRCISTWTAKKSI